MKRYAILLKDETLYFTSGEKRHKFFIEIIKDLKNFKDFLNGNIKLAIIKNKKKDWYIGDEYTRIKL